MTTELSRRAPAPLTKSALALWDPDQIALIKHTIMPEGANDGELALFLEVTARYELDPFTNQVWPVRYQGKIRNVVGRDGWIALADRREDYRGLQSFEIREHDLFIATLDDGGHFHVEHVWRDAEGNPTHGGADGMLRGAIIGGYAYARREGHIDSHFMAYSDQYNKAGEGKHNAWKSHPSAMTVKVAEAMALRKLYPLSGLFAEGEIQPDRQPTSLTAPGAAIEIDFGDDPELAAELEDAFRMVGWTRKKVRTVMRGCSTAEDRRQVLEEVRHELGVVDGSAMDAA